MREIVETIKEKLKTGLFAFRGVEVSERIAILATVASFVLILAVLFLIISFVLPRTRIQITISGPEQTIAGEEITYNVKVKNTGNVILKNSELVFHFPSFSLSEKGLIESILTEEDIYPGQEKNFEFNAQLFGQEGSRMEAKAWLNYSTKRDQTIKMSKTEALITSISEVPIDLILDIPKKIAILPDRESEFVFRARYFSLIDESIPNLKLAIRFPQDLTVKETLPIKEDEGRKEEGFIEEYWRTPRLESFSREEVEIRGSFPHGQEINKEMNFKAQLFINLHGSDILLKEFSVSSVTFKPSFLFTQTINTRENYSPYPGEILHYEIYFKNIEDKPLSNLTLSSVLEGNLFDLETIETPTGSFHKGGRSITWTGEEIPELRYLTPGEEGKIEFWVQLKQDYKLQDLTEVNASIKNRIILGDFEKEFRNRVSSRIKISQQGYFKDIYGFFENPGNHPPEVNKTTYYTIVWKIENYYNPIKNVEVKATLPQRVLFRSVKSAAGEIKVKTDPFEVESPYYPIIPRDFRFEKPLYQNLRNEEVRHLQVILKKEVPYAYPERVPATGLFGPITFEAVKAFQEKHRKDILTPQGIEAPTGYVDKQTQTKLNQLLMEGMPSGFSEVVWQIENLKPGIGVFEDPLIAAFQIAFTPEIAQKGKIATLVNEITFSAIDQWTEAILFSADVAIDTTLPDDTFVGKAGEIR